MNKKILILVSLFFINNQLYAIDDYSDLDIDETYEEYIILEKQDELRELKANRMDGIFIELDYNQELSHTSTLTNTTGSRKIVDNKPDTLRASTKVGLEDKNLLLYLGSDYKTKIIVDSKSINHYGGHLGVGYNFRNLFGTKYNKLTIFPSLYLQEGFIVMDNLTNQDYYGFQSVVGLDIVVGLYQSYELLLGYMLDYTIWENHIDGVSKTSRDSQIKIGLRIKL